MIVDVREVRKLQERRREINRVPFKEIRWVDGGLPVDVSESLARRWGLCGLNNIDFVEYVVDGDFRDAAAGVEAWVEGEKEESDK